MNHFPMVIFFSKMVIFQFHHYLSMKMVVYHQLVLHLLNFHRHLLMLIYTNKVINYHVVFVVFSSQHVVLQFYLIPMLLFLIVNKILRQYLIKKENLNIVLHQKFQRLNEKVLLFPVLLQQRILVMHQLVQIELFVYQLNKVYYVLN